MAALKGWKVAPDLSKISLGFVEKWKELYDAVKEELAKSSLMITDLKGYDIGNGQLKLRVTKNLHDFIEDEETLTAIKPAYMRMFPGLKLSYETVK